MAGSNKHVAITPAGKNVLVSATQLSPHRGPRAPTRTTVNTGICLADHEVKKEARRGRTEVTRQRKKVSVLSQNQVVSEWSFLSREQN